MPKPIIYTLIGSSGAGKSEMQKLLADKFVCLSWDKIREWDDRQRVLEESLGNKPVLLEISRLVSTTINRLTDFNFRLYYISATVDQIVENRIKRKPNKKVNIAGIESRIKRLESIHKKYGYFKGSFTEVLSALQCI